MDTFALFPIKPAESTLSSELPRASKDNTEVVDKLTGNGENDKVCPMLGLSIKLCSYDPGEKSGPQLSQQNPAGKKKRNITAS